MKRNVIWLLIPLALGILIAALVVAAPAQAGKDAQVAPPPAHHGPPGEEATGVVESFPDGLLGSWTVDGVVYTATNRTHFWMFGGPFYMGACVRVLYDPQSYNAYAIGMVSSERCSQEARLQMIGLIEQTPDAYSGTLHTEPGISGTWVISGTSFVSTMDTRLITRNGSLVVGACAQVSYREVNGENVADEIRSEKLYRCFGRGSYNQAYGYVVTFPDDWVGAWIISNTASTSVTFMSTEATQIYTDGHPLDIGTCVKVKYFNDDGVNYAARVRTLNTRICQLIFDELQPLSKIYATVDTMPPTGTVTGTWTLAGVNFTSTQQTRIDDEQEPLAVGSCAEAKYDPTNGAMLLRKLEGEQDWDCQAFDGSPRFKLFGVVEALPSEGYTGTWQVSGVSFTVTPSTTVESRHGEIITGAFVKVYFTYDPASGERTAQVVKSHVAPGYGRLNFFGRFGGWFHTRLGSQIVLDGRRITADPDIEIPDGLKDGQPVWVNAYQEPDGVYVTEVAVNNPVFLPMIKQ
jgi:hypothetical protein